MVRCWYATGPLMFSLCVPSSGFKDERETIWDEQAEECE